MVINSDNILKKAKSWLLYSFDNPNYLYLLLSILGLLVSGAISIKFPGYNWMRDFCLGIVIFLGPFYASLSILSFISHFILGGLILIISQSALSLTTNGNIFISFLMFAFFYLLFYKVILSVWKERNIDFNALLAVVCGYLILGIMSSFIFKIINILIPNSFSFEGPGDYFNFIYFSFITITSIGFGDIVPIDTISKMATIILSIAGQIYITVVMAMFVAKYTAKRGL